MISYQHIFWFYSHPAVYIMMLPGFGIISEVISTHSRKPIFGYRLMALALIGIVVLSYTVWAHHMFVSGMFSWLRVPMMITTLLIAVPTGIKIFSWLGTLFGSVLHLYSTAMLFALGFIVTFTIGGISGVMLGMVPLDIHVSDTYFIVAHIHFVLFGGSVFTIFAGIYHWFPKMTGRMYDEKLGRLHFWLTFVGDAGRLPPDALDRDGGDAAPRRRLLGPVRRLEPADLVLRLPARRRAADLPLQHGRQLALGPARARQPVAGEDDRVAGLLAAADLQLPRDPARRRRPVRVRRARRQARDHAGRGGRGDRARAGDRGRRQTVTDGRRHDVLAFLNEVAGGRRLLETLRERDLRRRRVGRRRGARRTSRSRARSSTRTSSARRPRAASRSPRRCCREFGIEAVGAVMTPTRRSRSTTPCAPSRPDEILISCLADTRFGLLRRDLVEWARSRFEVPVTHIPVRIEDDAVRWDVTHTLVVATQTVDSPDLVAHLKSRAAERPHRYTIISPRSGEITREEVCERLARTLAELYRAEIDATGQPMSPEPLAAVENAIEHYRIDEILISTFAGQQSKWLEEGLLEKVEGDERQARRARRSRAALLRSRRRPAAGRRRGGQRWNRRR